MDMLSFGGTVVPSCMLGAGIWGTYGSKLRNFINPLFFSQQHQIIKSKGFENYQIDYRREHALILNQILLTILKKKMYGGKSGEFVCGSLG